MSCMSESALPPMMLSGLEPVIIGAVYSVEDRAEGLSRKVSDGQHQLFQLFCIDAEGANALGQLFGGHGVFVMGPAEISL